jgi:hypothetical protein
LDSWNWEKVWHLKGIMFFFWFDKRFIYVINWELYIYIIYIYAVLLHETKHDFGKKDMGRQILDYVKVSEGGRSEIQYPASQYIPCTIYKPI